MIKNWDKYELSIMKATSLCQNCMDHSYYT